MCHEDAESEVRGYPLIKSTPCSTPVSLYIPDIFLHTFQSFINKAVVPFHPYPYRVSYFQKNLKQTSLEKVGEMPVKEKTKQKAKNWRCNICTPPLNKIH